MYRYKNLIKNYFEKHSLVDSNIKSFNNFIERGIQKVIDENKDIVPTIIPSEVSEYKIKLGKIEIEKPQIVESDGSKKPIYPAEARLRKLTYSAPVYLNVSAIIDGNERVLIIVEDLASNKFFVDKSKTGPSPFVGKVYSEKGSYRIPHLIEQMRTGTFYLTFTRFTRVPIIVVIKALGLFKDEDIAKTISTENLYDDIFINLYDAVEIKTQDDAVEFLSKKIGISQQDDRKKRIFEMFDKYLLPHIGLTKETRITKAYNLCKYIKKFLIVSKEGLSQEDKDHYMNKRLKLSGDLLEDLFRVNMSSLIQDMLYNFQRLVKRGKLQSIKIIIRDQL